MAQIGDKKDRVFFAWWPVREKRCGLRGIIARIHWVIGPPSSLPCCRCGRAGWIWLERVYEIRTQVTPEGVEDRWKVESRRGMGG